MTFLLSNFDFEQILKGSEGWSFHWEIVFRTIIMYLVILTALSAMGKRGVKQLSVFELVIIISFGSAAGDPMFYKEVGLINAITVLGIIILMYKLTTLVVFRSSKIEKFIEGEPMCLVDCGKFSLSNFNKETLGYDEFFAEMRQYSVSHLGQIEKAIMEINGEVSLYYYPDKEVKYGLPILPELYAEKHRQILRETYYSCSFCGHTEIIKPTDRHLCPICKKSEWVISINKCRIT